MPPKPTTTTSTTITPPADGRRVVTMAFSGDTLPHSPPPAGKEWRSAVIDPARIVTDATRARQLGAEIVVVSVHWGNEGIAEPTETQVAVADAHTGTALRAQLTESLHRTEHVVGPFIHR